MKNNPLEFRYPELYKMAEKKALEYKINKPFPHIILDRFLSPLAYKKILTAFPKRDSEFYDRRAMKEHEISCGKYTYQLMCPKQRHNAQRKIQENRSPHQKN